ncbi:MAG: GNAT family N-acetyltransferase [Dehalococcoidia bacterium]|nr:MAG: GNAT family N-acetyltransferase [Dehalococcoidia bacterium]
MSEIHIDDLDAADDALVEQTARVLFEAFQAVTDWLTDIEAARAEVRESLEPGRLSLVARDEAGAVLGWIGGQHEYARVWELHPLAVSPPQQRRGVGQALVAALEARVAALGGLTLRLGTDDEAVPGTGTGRTSLFGVDLYEGEPLKHLLGIRNLRGHPYEFYLACGFAIVGVVPDANGRGEPDILMARRVGAGIHEDPSGRV